MVATTNGKWNCYSLEASSLGGTTGGTTRGHWRCTTGGTTEAPPEAPLSTEAPTGGNDLRHHWGTKSEAPLEAPLEATRLIKFTEVHWRYKMDGVLLVGWVSTGRGGTTGSGTGVEVLVVEVLEVGVLEGSGNPPLPSESSTPLLQSSLPLQLIPLFLIGRSSQALNSYISSFRLLDHIFHWWYYPAACYFTIHYLTNPTDKLQVSTLSFFLKKCFAIWFSCFLILIPTTTPSELTFCSTCLSPDAPNQKNRDSAPLSWESPSNPSNDLSKLCYKHLFWWQ
jgi:hypothetical protein